MMDDAAGPGKGPVSNKVAFGAVLLLGSNLGVRLLGVVNLLILARLLTPEDFGVTALALVVVGFAKAVTDFQIGLALVRMPEPGRSHFDTVFTLTLLRGVALAAAVFLSADLLAGAMNEPALADVLRVVAIIPLIEGLHSPYISVFTRRIDFRSQVVILLLSRASLTIVAIGFALVRDDYWALIFGNIAASLVYIALSHVVIPRRLRMDMTHWREFMAFGGWMTGAGMCRYVGEKADAVLLGVKLDASAVGLYNVGEQMASMATSQLTHPFLRATYPGLAAAQHDPDRLRNAYLRTQATMLGVLLPIGVGASLTAHELVVLLAGPGWGDAVLVVQALAVVMALNTLVAGVDSIMMVVADTRRVFVRNVLTLAIHLPALIAGVTFFGFVGVIWARAFSTVIQTIASLQLASRITGAWWRPLEAAWRSIAAAALMALAVLPIDGLLAPTEGSAAAAIALAVKAAVGSAVYIGAHLALWRFSGSPDGFESFVLSAAQKALRKAGLPV
jgi:lipopolysaccharide exporter